MRRPLIVGIGGTTLPRSATERILRASLDAAAMLGARTRLYSGADLSLPPYAPGARDPRARRLVEALARADGVIVASPAYHGTISGLVKNALDHVEELRTAKRPYLEGRAVGAIAVAGGPQAGATTLQALRTVVHALRGWPTPLGVAVDTSDRVFDATGAVDDAVVLARLDLLAEQVVGFARASGDAGPGTSARRRRARSASGAGRGRAPCPP
jgi:FMN reductase